MPELAMSLRPKLGGRKTTSTNIYSKSRLPRLRQFFCDIHLLRNKDQMSVTVHMAKMKSNTYNDVFCDSKTHNSR